MPQRPSVGAVLVGGWLAGSSADVWLLLVAETSRRKCVCAAHFIGSFIAPPRRLGNEVVVVVGGVWCRCWRRRRKAEARSDGEENWGRRWGWGFQLLERRPTSTTFGQDINIDAPMMTAAAAAYLLFCASVD